MHDILVSCRLTLPQIIREAYSVRPWQQSGGPSWLNAELFEVAAVMPEDTTRDTARLMLQSMLTDRFGLVFHRETKTVPVYSLVLGPESNRLQPARESGASE